MFQPDRYLKNFKNLKKNYIERYKLIINKCYNVDKEKRLGKRHFRLKYETITWNLLETIMRHKWTINEQIKALKSEYLRIIHWIKKLHTGL